MSSLVTEPAASIASREAKKQARKRTPKPASERRISILEQPTRDTDGWGALRIDIIDTVRQARRVESHTYLFREIPAEGMGAGCRGFELEKLDAFLDPTGDVYHVLVHPRGDGSACDCKGCTAHSHCKHLSGVQAAIKAGRLPAPAYRSGGDMAANDPTAYAEHVASLGDFGCSPTYGMAEGEYPDEPPQLDEAAYFDSPADAA